MTAICQCAQARIIHDDKENPHCSKCGNWWIEKYGSTAPLTDRDLMDKITFLLNQKVGRNDPCPCGSGKKFKKCCIK